jgi:hypothetical protein
MRENVQREPHNLKSGTNSRDTDDVGHKTQNKDKQKKTQITSKMIWKK